MCTEILLLITGEGPGPPELSFKSFTFDWGCDVPVLQELKEN